MKISLFMQRDFSPVHSNGRQLGWTAFELRWLAGLLLFNGVGAVGGGIALLTDNIGLPLSLLDGTPFSTYVIPGWILLVVVGGSSIAASFLVWRMSRFSVEASVAAGLILLGWITTEFVMIPGAWMPQLLYFLLAFVIIRLGMRGYGVRSTSRTSSHQRYGRTNR